MHTLPKSFVERIIADLSKEEGEHLLEAIERGVSPTSIRMNDRKVRNLSFETGMEKIPWTEYGFYLETRPSFTLDPMLHGGAYYVQEASSMVLEHVIQELGLNQSPITALDLCAAPGGKTTLLVNVLDAESTIVANEVIKNRAQILKENIIKWSAPNAIVTSNDPKDFARIEESFDLMLIDAPCSGEGMFRKDIASRAEWSEEHVTLCSSRQNRILDDVLPALKPGGILIYSTCTYNNAENINQVEKLVAEGYLSLEIKLSKAWGFTEIKGEQSFAYQAYPHKVKGEGFFFAVLQKPQEKSSSQIKDAFITKLKPTTKLEKELIKQFVELDYLEDTWIHQNGDVYYFKKEICPMIAMIQKYLNLVYAGIKLGNLNKQLFIPDHALALSPLLNSKLPKKELSLEDAQNYLRRSLTQIESAEKGWSLALYQNQILGWYKQLGNRINNYYPNEWRIKHL